MPTYLDVRKRDPKTGKLKKTGEKNLIGRISRGSKGGYSFGEVTRDMRPTGKKAGRNQDVYAKPSQPIVPNFAANTSTATGPVYTPPPMFAGVPNTSTNAGPVYTPPPSFAAPNTSTNAGPVYTPPPQAPVPTPEEAPSSSVAPSTPGGGAQPSSPISSTGAAPTPLVNGVDPRYSYISQTGRYQYDFWTPEGQAERIQNMFEVSGFGRTSIQFSGGEEDPSRIPFGRTTVNALNAAAIVYGATAVWRSLANMGRVGAIAAGPNGAAQLAATTKEAATATNTAKALGELGKNPNTIKKSIDFVKGLMTTRKLLTLGGTLGFLGLGMSQTSTAEKDAIDYTRDSGLLALKLRQAGMTDMADELDRTNRDLREALDDVIPYLPYFTKRASDKAITEARDNLFNAEIAYQTEVYRQAQEKALAAQEAEVQQELEQRAYNEEREAEQRTYNEQQKQEQRTYNEQQTRAAIEAQIRAEDTATQESGGSTLTFGLLGGGSSREFVDKNKAARVYFGKPYDELTPEQKLLLNLLKGGN